MSRPELRVLVSDAGGRWFGDLRSWWWIGPIWGLMSLLVTPGLDSWSEVGWAVLGNIVGVLAVVGLIAFARVWLFPNRAERPAPLSVVLIFSALLGAVKALVTLGMTAAFSGDPIPNLWGRVIFVTLLATFSYPWIAVVLAMRDRLERERAQLVRHLVRERFAEGMDSPPTADPRVLTFLQNAREHVAAADSPQQLSRTLRSVVDDGLRPLSRALLAESDREVPRLHMADLVQLTLRGQEYTPLLTVAAFLLVFAQPQLSEAGLAVGAARIAYQVALILAVLYLARLLPKSGLGFGAAAYAVIILVLTFGVGIGTTILFGAIPAFPVAESTLLLAGFFTGVVIVLGAVRLAVTQGAQIHARLEEFAVHDARVESLATLERLRRREFAHYLHSRVQNDLLNLAMRLETVPTAQLSDEAELLETLLVELGSLEPARSARSLDEVLNDLRRRWNGVVDLQVTVQGELNDASQVDVIDLVLNEVLTNAVRHGSATAVTITLQLSTTVAEIRCLDNGVLLGVASAGVGTDLFTAAAGTNWALTATPDGTLLELQIPVTSFEFGSIEPHRRERHD